MGTLAPIVYSDGSFALRAQVGSVLLRASGTINGDLWSGVTSVLIPEVDTRVEVSLGMMTNASFGSVSGRILEAGGLVGAADAICKSAPMCLRVWIPGAPTFRIESWVPSFRTLLGTLAFQMFRLEI